MAQFLKSESHNDTVVATVCWHFLQTLMNVKQRKTTWQRASHAPTNQAATSVAVALTLATESRTKSSVKVYHS